jgi:hypothetical protein
MLLQDTGASMRLYCGSFLFSFKFPHSTKIHAIKASVSGAVNYICNEEKTDSSLYISLFATSPETAADDFKFTLSHTDCSDPNKAFHLIQSFAPGEVSAEEAPVYPFHGHLLC